MTLVGAGEGGGFATSAKLKLDELFVTWLSYSDTCQFISNVISSFKLSPTSPASPQDSPILDGSSVISPRKFSPRKCILLILFTLLCTFNYSHYIYLPT